LRSVEKALKALGHPVIVTQDKNNVKNASGIILPGVGSFDVAVKSLRETTLESAIVESIAVGKPYLGICLGMQMLFEESEEGNSKGFGVLPGRAVRFNFKGHPMEKKLKVPHMGWNSIRISADCPIYKGVENGSMLYFVHSYYVEPKDESIVATTTEYGKDFVSSIYKGNIYGTQFHVEKSGDIGLKILDNFAKLCKKS